MMTNIIMWNIMRGVGVLLALNIPKVGTAFITNPKCLTENGYIVKLGKNKRLTLDTKHISSMGVVSNDKRSKSLQMAIFDDISKFFGPDDNDDRKDDLNRRKNNNDSFSSSDDENDDDNDENDSSYYTGTSRIFEIPARKLKVGGMRLYLSLHLMGERNNPEKNCWRLDQNGDGGIDLFYRDQTGAIFINFTETGVTFDRFGSAPSMTYTMHETIILNSILDKLDEITFDQDIPESDRLMQLNQPCNAIQDAREMLSFS